ncbi:hypothetical protein EV175_006644 [Coemansia sp. RSA 1933]|nr:hypothetical protein EV175_006644 [Coemansia sp. RSA 1933]
MLPVRTVVTTASRWSALNRKQAVAIRSQMRVYDRFRCPPAFLQLRSLSTTNSARSDALGAARYSLATKEQTTVAPANGDKVTSANAPPDDVDLMDKVELRVGLVKAVERHPDADMLYVLSVDLGESDPTGDVGRTIVSGLVKYYAMEELLQKKVVVFANMKARKLRGIVSQGMLLAASKMNVDDTRTVEVLEAPRDAQPGDRITTTCLGSQDGMPETSRLSKSLVKKQKDVDAFMEQLVLDDRTAMYKGRKLVAENGGSIRTQSMASGTIG